MSVLIVDRALLRIRQHLAGFLGLFEELLGLLVIRIAVGMVLHRQPPVGLLDLRLSSGLGYVEYLVVIALGHALFQIPETTGPAVRRSGLFTRESYRSSLRSFPVLVF